MEHFIQNDSKAVAVGSFLDRIGLFDKELQSDADAVKPESNYVIREARAFAFESETQRVINVPSVGDLTSNPFGRHVCGCACAIAVDHDVSLVQFDHKV